MNMKVMVGLMGLLSALALCVVLNLASGVFIPLVIAWFILQVFRPVVQLGRKLRLPPLLNITLVFALLFCLGVIGVHFCTSQVVEFSRVYSRYAPQLGDRFNDFMTRLRVSPEMVDSFNWLAILRDNMRNISGLLIALSSKLVMTLVFLMFLLLEAPYTEEKVNKAFSGPSAARIRKILNTISEQISRYLGTLTLISLATGLCAWGVLTVMEVELATGWAVLTFLLNFIPTVGSIIATIPPVVMAGIQFPSLFEPVAVLIALTAIQITIGNVITPKVVGDRLGVSPVIILLSLMLWGTIWGIPGALLSVPIVSIIKIVCENIHSLRPIAILMGSGQAARRAPLPPEPRKPKGSAHFPYVQAPGQQEAGQEDGPSQEGAEPATRTSPQ